MSATYEPGTVAVATVRGVPNVRVFRLREGTWVSAEPAGVHSTRVQHDEEVTDVRSLVTLDPSEFIAENLVPLLLATAKKGTEGLCARRSAVRFVADQIEAQTRPPKPAEPTALWAVVEGRDGNRWVKEHDGNLCWRHIGSVDRSTSWEGITTAYLPVRVLSEGVTA